MLNEIRNELEGALGDFGVEACRFDVGVPHDAAYGHVFTNAAMVCAGSVSLAPRELAVKLVAKLKGDARFEAVWVAGEGFVNLRISAAYADVVVERICAAPENFGAGQQELSFVAAYLSGPNELRQKWSAEAAVNLATHLGAGCEINTRGEVNSVARNSLAAVVEAEPQFGHASPAELEGLAKQLAIINASLSRADRVRFFARQDTDFRPGLFEAISGPKVSCHALAELRFSDDLSESAYDLAKLTCLSQRSDRPLLISQDHLMAARASNAAFLVQYTALKCRTAIRPKQPDSLDAYNLCLLCRLASFPEVLLLAHRLGEPQRVGLFLAQIAEILSPMASIGRPNRSMRDQKSISSRVLAVADVVFSVGLSILNVQPLDEIS